ncbi:putative glutathione-dependent formaldehyde-activating enzyme protein [Cladorrhinum sp. PSN259]|nr:putative glutathione-dependent formaldehyde-activating enzyme protein [Cladorrhinum sp. PSN259]
MRVVCQCKSVDFQTPTPKPLSVYHCHCLECQKQSSSAFGTSAIFPADGIFPLSQNLKSRPAVWTRSANQGRTMDCYFCRECGVRVMHRIREPDGNERGTVSIKGGTIEGLDMSGAKHIYTRSAVVPIPDGFESWENEPPRMEGREKESEPATE